MRFFPSLGTSFLLALALGVLAAPAQAAWLSKTYRPQMNGSISNLAQADNAIATGVLQNPGGTLLNVINMFDVGGNGGIGNFTGDDPIPGLGAGNNDDFAVISTGILTVAVGGTYNFLTNTDDGTRLRIDGLAVITDDNLLPPMTPRDRSACRPGTTRSSTFGSNAAAGPRRRWPLG